LLFYFYPAKGEAGKPKTTFPPLVQALVAMDTGKIVKVECAPLFWPVEQKPDQPLGQYPGASLCGLSLQETDALYQKYYGLCDRLFLETAVTDLGSCPVYPLWVAAFNRVREDGFEAYYAPYITRILSSLPSGVSTIAYPRSPAAKPEHTSTPRVVPPFRPHKRIDVCVHLEAAKRLLVNAGLDALLPTWREIAARRENLFFSVAVIGEISRGKSSLLNRLLGEDILPVGDLPTTAILTRIRNGGRKSGCRILATKIREELVPTAEELRRFKADPEGCDPEGVIQIELPNLWLSDNRLILYDTPGAADLTGQRAALTVEAITRCDAAIVVINATMPCSLTEMEFIHGHVVAKRMPRVAAAISKLDLIPPHERGAVISHIASKMRDLSTSIELWSVHSQAEIPETSDSQIIAAGPDAIRARVSAWACDADIEGCRDIQAATQLQCLLASATNVLGKQLTTARLSSDEQIKCIQKERAAIARAAMDWDDIKIVLDAKALQTEQALFKALAERTTDVAGELHYSLTKSNNPQAWWKEDFPVKLRRQVELLAKSVGQQIEQLVVSHHAWLDQTVRSRFALDGIVSLETSLLERDVASIGIPGSPALTDLDHRRKVSRIALLGGTVASYLMFGPLAVGVSGGLALWSESTLKRLMDDQKIVSRSTVDASVDEVFNILHKRLSQRIRGWYKTMFDAIRQEAAQWQTAQLTAVEKGVDISEPEVKGIEALVDQAARQLQTINMDMEAKHDGP